MQIINKWHQFDTTTQVAESVCEHVLQIARDAINARGCFKIVLAGGGTPEKIYNQLANADMDWSKWFVYYGDERCLPVDDRERNSVMATQALLAKTGIPEQNVFTMATELGVVQAAEDYRRLIANVDQFDLVLLGMGEDGHTASLFPGHEHNPEESVHEVYNSPKPPSQRISLSAKTLANTRHLFFIVTGASKREAVKQWQQGEALPVATICPTSGIDVFIDKLVVG